MLDEAKNHQLGSELYISKSEPTVVSSESFSDSKRAAAIGTLCRLSVKSINKTIAGREVYSMNCKFTNDQDNPQLIECSIIFRDGKKESVNQIHEALVARYGEPTVSGNIECVWLGANNTVIVHKESILIFATLDGLALADSFAVEKEPKKDVGF